ncbi:Protease [Rhynchospora pubera]|uniref:Protease n=1 Tax=Rhynchospora pubera TaxID=906938 RepID=A0AAV8GFB4_9POAL|nr:Protease [Rhynchospora pubera]
MTSVLPSHPNNRLIQVQDRFSGGRSNKLRLLGQPNIELPLGKSSFSNRRKLTSLQQTCSYNAIVLRALNSGSNGEGSSDDEDDDQENSSDKAEVNFRISREDLERMVGADDSKFSGLDLANLIKEKYGRSYDVQLIKKEFMGKNLLAMNVMWKYREQRSFPLSEEEYLLRLDDVANTLKCWGAVSHVRNSLAKLKERPRIGKAVSIFIDMDESGGRSNEWIYK